MLDPFLGIGHAAIAAKTCKDTRPLPSTVRLVGPDPLPGSKRLWASGADEMTLAHARKCPLPQTRRELEVIDGIGRRVLPLFALRAGD